MRIFVLSNVSGGVDPIVELLKDDHSVVAKEMAAEPGEAANTIEEQVGTGKYDVHILVSEDPIKINLMLNKREGVTSVVCGNAEDVELANENGANVLVMRSLSQESLEDVIRAVEKMPWRSKKGGVSSAIKSIEKPFKRPQSARTAPQVQTPVAQHQDKKSFSLPLVKFSLHGKKPQQGAENNETYKNPQPPAPRKGIGGKIKDSLGIV